MARVILKGEAKPPPPKPIQHSDHPARQDHVRKEVFPGRPFKEDELQAPEEKSSEEESSKSPPVVLARLRDFVRRVRATREIAEWTTLEGDVDVVTRWS